MKSPLTISISPSTKQKALSAKLYIQRRYTNFIQSQQQKKLNWQKLYQKMNALSLPSHQKSLIKQTILHKQAQILRETRHKQSISDYDFIKVIGKGAFGEVRLYRERKTNEAVAIKRMVKTEMIFKNKILQAKMEQNVMVKLSQMACNRHVVKLMSSFQDEKYLYLVMEYLGGGDMMGLLIKKDVFSEDEARFYVAELVLAIQCVHKLKYIHRDLKPDNVLIDKDGHLKLSDFGLCKHTEIVGTTPKSLLQILKQQQKNTGEDKEKIRNKLNYTNTLHKRKLAFSTVGTPDYVAPEVQSRNGYTQTVDWWSLGVILFQMLVGYPPFFGQNPQKTWENIQNWRKVLHIPKQKNLSPHAIDLIKKLINDEKYRLGTNGVEEIKAHPFFIGVNWKSIKDMIPPNVPELSGLYDTQYFDKYEDGQQWVEEKQRNEKETNKVKQNRKDNKFVGYTFKQNPKENSELLKALVDLDSLMPTKSKNVINRDRSLNQNKRDKSQMSRGKKEEVALKTGSKTLILNSNNVNQGKFDILKNYFDLNKLKNKAEEATADKKTRIVSPNKANVQSNS